MQANLRNAIVFLLAAVALISIVAFFSNPGNALQSLDFVAFAFGTLLFILSIFFWLLAWAWLLRKSHKISYKKLFLLGFASVYGSLSPVQLGSEALRSIQLKHFFKVPYSFSVAVSMMVKAIKFLLLLILSLFVLGFFFSSLKIDSFLLFGFASAILAILAAVLLFLLPFSKRFAAIIVKIFSKLSRFHKIFLKLAEFFKNYANYTKKITAGQIAFVTTTNAISWLFEIGALYFAFFSVQAGISLYALVVFFVVSALLERAPFLPRGIGLVEIVGAAMLSIPGFTGSQLSLGQIGAVLIVFDLFRLIIPTLLSLGVFVYVEKKFVRLLPGR